MDGEQRRVSAGRAHNEGAGAVRGREDLHGGAAAWRLDADASWKGRKVAKDSVIPGLTWGGKRYAFAGFSFEKLAIDAGECDSPLVICMSYLRSACSAFSHPELDSIAVTRCQLVHLAASAPCTSISPPQSSALLVFEFFSCASCRKSSFSPHRPPRPPSSIRSSASIITTELPLITHIPIRTFSPLGLLSLASSRTMLRKTCLWL